MSEAKRYKLFQDVCYDDGAFVIPAGQVMVREADYNALRDERDRIVKEYVRLFRLCEPIAKMLSELSILPIGCSREQELAWKMAVKNFRHYQQDYAADVLLQAALMPAGGGGRCGQ